MGDEWSVALLGGGPGSWLISVCASHRRMCVTRGNPSRGRPNLKPVGAVSFRMDRKNSSGTGCFISSHEGGEMVLEGGFRLFPC